MKIYKNTAFVKDMFTSQVEAAKFEGAQVRSVSGIRGIIKKSLRKPEGVVRITFEDRVQYSDIIFCKTWVNLAIPSMYLPVTNLLQADAQKSDWQGLKTAGEIRKERDIKLKQRSDSLYKPVQRKKRVFHKLTVPKELKKDLPYKTKMKNQQKQIAGVNKATRVPVLREEKDKKVANLFNILGAAQNERKEKRKADSKARTEKYKALIQKQQLKRQRQNKDLKKKIYSNLQKEVSK